MPVRAGHLALGRGVPQALGVAVADGSTSTDGLIALLGELGVVYGTILVRNRVPWGMGRAGLCFRRLPQDIIEEPVLASVQTHRNEDHYDDQLELRKLP